jgi:hypothetical protein
VPLILDRSSQFRRSAPDPPADRLFGGDIEDLEPTGMGYDPDDAAPWSWNLKADLFVDDPEWSELLDPLLSHGPES